MIQPSLPLPFTGTVGWTDEQKEELRVVWHEERGRVRRVARRLKRTMGQISGQIMRLNLPAISMGDRRIAVKLDHPAIVFGRSTHPSKVRDVRKYVSVLKEGRANRKIGDRITKGRWRGMPIYTLTLEERTTCPKSCQQWLACYGNNMNNARRWRHGPELIRKLADELQHLDASKRCRDGFVVRLHVLGDFWSKEYVEAWMSWLIMFPRLRIYGYTTHHPAESPLGRMLHEMTRRCWDRFAMRFSNSGLPTHATAVLPNEGQRGRIGQGVVCPVETLDTRSCATCGLCWQSPTPNIVFLEH